MISRGRTEKTRRGNPSRKLKAAPRHPAPHARAHWRCDLRGVLRRRTIRNVEQGGGGCTRDVERPLSELGNMCQALRRR